MALDKKDLEAIRLLMDETVEKRLEPFREENKTLRQELREEIGSVRVMVNQVSQEFGEFRQEVRERFNQVDNNFDALFLRDEKREQEYEMLREQHAKLEDRVEAVEKKVA